MANSWRTYARALVLAQTLMLLVCAAGTHGWFGPVAANTTDFASFYAAGTLANHGHAADAYRQAAHWAAERAIAGPSVFYVWFLYPPPFLLLCGLLAHMPYLLAFLLFQLAGLAALLTGMKAIAGRAAMLPVCALGSLYWTVGLGQNSCFSAAIFAWGTVLLARRPWLAGAVFGLLAYKPHFGLLLPVALVAAGAWRAVGGAAAMVALLCGASWLAYGASPWIGFFHALAGADQVYGGQAVRLAAQVSVFGGARLVGIPDGLAWWIQALAGVGVASLVGLVWRRCPKIAPRAAVLCGGVLLTVPVALFYDLLLCAVGAAWLVRGGGLGTHPRRWLAAGVAIDLVCYPVALLTHWPVGLVIPAGLLALGVRAAGVIVPSRLWTILTRRRSATQAKGSRHEVPYAVEE